MACTCMVTAPGGMHLAADMHVMYSFQDASAAFRLSQPLVATLLIRGLDKVLRNNWCSLHGW